MRSKASVAHDFMKVSRDLEEALARGAFTACELRIISWLKARTYGVRVKGDEGWFALDATPLTACFLSLDMGLNRQRVKESVEALLSDQVLRRKTNGWIGINSRIGDWKRAMQGRDFDFHAKPRSDIGQRTWDKAYQVQGVSGTPVQGVPVTPVQGVPGRLVQGVPGRAVPSKERARVETVEGEIGERPPTLPNGKNDTPAARAELGSADFPPHDLAAFSRLSFKLQDRIAERWETRVAEERKKTSCRKCQTRPRHSESWPYCRTCTVCSVCERPAGGGMVYHATKSGLKCNDCKTTEKP